MTKTSADLGESKAHAVLDPSLSDLLQSIIQQRKVRPKPLIMSFYSDCIVPRGGSVWLSTIVAVSNMLGIEDHLSRTSALRLVYDGWLVNNRSGRSSYYSMSENYTKTYLDFQSRVYSDPAQLRQQNWMLLMLTGDFDDLKERNSIIKELLWHGFGAVEPRLFLHASLSEEAAQRILELTIGERGALLTQFDYRKVHWETLANLIAKGWDLKHVIHDYQEFCGNFRKIDSWLRARRAPITPLEAVAIRVLLIHEYRRITLRDPHLPKEFTGVAWPGDEAFALMRTVYAMTFDVSEAYLDDVLTSLDVPAEARKAAVAQRFGGWWPGSPPAGEISGAIGNKPEPEERRSKRRRTPKH